MSSATFPVILQHLDACGLKDGRRVATSIVPVLAVLLVARGSDHLIIPTPHPTDRERAEAGIARLPAERQSFVSMCDTDGELLARVRNYTELLRREARKWPEDAFVAFAEDFLYELLLATHQCAAILSSSASTVREFLPIVDPTQFTGEARFRLAEIYRLVCNYEPAVIDHGQYIIESRRDAGASAWDLLKMAEFRALVGASGRIGYLKHPLLGLRRLGDRLRELIRKAPAKGLIKLASTAADAAGAGGLAGAAGEALGFAANADDKPFHPPFLSLSPVELPLYRAALREGLPGAVPPDGTIMLFEIMRGGRAAHAWLSIGEEGKLEREAREGLRPRVARYHAARRALDRLMG
jgi:hypothetical protein